MKDMLHTLFAHGTLTKEEAKRALTGIGRGEYNNSSVAAFMSVFLMRNISVEELSGFREALLELCLPVKFSIENTIDIVGTGGDGKNTFNISTLSCLVAAGAGARVTKHGNYGVSSVSGSSNVLEKAGVKFTNDVSLLNMQLEEAGICFMHAPLFHPAMKSVAPIRKELSVRTFFNLLGPLVNPCRPQHMLLGTYNLEVMRLYHYLLQETDHSYRIIHALDGYDEISLTGKLRIVDKSGEHVYSPLELGFAEVTPSDISGGESPDDSARIFMNIISGKGSRSQNEVVIVNAAMAVQCVFPHRSWEDCVESCRESLLTGNALLSLKKIIQSTN